MMKTITTAAIAATASKLWGHSNTKYAVRHIRRKLGEMIAGKEMITRDGIKDQLDNIEGFLSDLRYQGYEAPERPLEPSLSKDILDHEDKERGFRGHPTDLEALSDPDGWCQGDVPDLK